MCGLNPDCGGDCVACPEADAIGVNCSASCPTRDHKTWGECIRGKGLRVGWASTVNGLDASHERRNVRELDLYAATRKQGIQPDNTSTAAIHRALDASEATGSAYVSTL